MQKRGTTHIEMVLTFVLFIAVVGFAFYFFNPFKIEKESASAYYALNEVIKDLESEVITYNLIINDSAIPPAQDSLVINATFETSLAGLNMSVKNKSEFNIPFLLLGDKIYFNWKREMGKEIRVRVSKSINEGQADTSLAISSAKDSYILSSWQNTSIVSQNKTALFISRYNNQYRNVTASLGLPSNKDFSFIISLNKSLLDPITERTSLNNLEVSSETRLVEFITYDGNITFVEIGVKVW